MGGTVERRLEEVDGPDLVRGWARRPLAGVAMAAVLGILGAEFWDVPPWAAAGVCGCAWVAVWRWRRTLPCLALVAAVFFFMHGLGTRHAPGLVLARGLGEDVVAVRVEGVVVEEPDLLETVGRKGGSCFRFRLKRLWRCGGEGSTGELLGCDGVEFRVVWRGAVPEFGAFLELEGAAQRVGRARNPGEFDRSAWLERRGIWTELRVDSARDGRVLGLGMGGVLEGFAIRARRWVRGRLEAGVGDGRPLAAVVESMVLGVRGGTEWRVREWFRETGTLHLFAVSGQNVMMLAVLVGWVFRWLRVPRGLGAWGLLGVLFLYALVTGWSASCVRAAVMGGLLVGGLLVDRPPVLHNSVAAGALVILGWDTRQLFDRGFELSFLQVLVLAWGAPRFAGWLGPLGMPDPFLPRRLWSVLQGWVARVWVVVSGTLAVAVAGWAGSLPVSLWSFHLWSPAGLLANVYVVPLAFVVLSVGLLSVGVGWVVEPLGGALNQLNGWVVRLLIAGLEFFAGLPGGHAHVGRPRIPAPAWQLTVFDLGGGGAVHLEAGGVDWLLDCGSASGFRRVVLPALRERGVDRLAGLLLTHGDTEHTGGAMEVVRELDPGQVAVGPARERSPGMRRLHAELGRMGRGFAFYHAGEVVGLGDGMELQVLYPPAGMECAVADDRALVCRLVTSCGRVLLSSDAGYRTEQWLLERGVDVAADVWVRGWNVRDPGGTREFLGAVNPVAVVFPGGPGRRGFCGTEAAGAAVGCAEFGQDRTGAVRVAGYGGGMLELTGFLNGQRLRSFAR